MSSQIDPTVIRDDQKVQKSDLREQLQIAADEISALQVKVSVAYQMAFSDASFDSL